MATTVNFGIFLLVGLSILGSSLAADVLEGNYNVTAFCSTVKVGTLLGSIVSCNYYYVCSSSGPQNTSCSVDHAFDLAKQQCLPQNEVNCYYGVENVCANKEGNNWVPVTGTCNGWIYCNGTVNSGSGTCGANQKFDVTTSSCVWGQCSSTTSNDDTPTLTDICEVVPPSIYFGDTSNCVKWNYCLANGTKESGSCEDQDRSAFIVSTGQCGYNSDGVCSRVTGEDLGTPSTECNTAGEIKANNKTCGSYYICNNQNWQVVDCTYGYYFDTLSSKCVARQAAVAAVGCDRCQYSTKTFVNAVNQTTCGSYFYCNNGVGTLGNCQSGEFFNENLQGCAPDSGLSAYVPNNGACYGATAGGDSGSSTDETTTSSGSEDTTTTTTTTTTEASTTESTSTTKE